MHGQKKQRCVALGSIFVKCIAWCSFKRRLYCRWNILVPRLQMRYSDLTKSSSTGIVVLVMASTVTWPYCGLVTPHRLLVFGPLSVGSKHDIICHPNQSWFIPWHSFVIFPWQLLTVNWIQQISIKFNSNAYLNSRKCTWIYCPQNVRL